MMSVMIHAAGLHQFNAAGIDDREARRAAETSLQFADRPSRHARQGQRAFPGGAVGDADGTAVPSAGNGEAGDRRSSNSMPTGSCSQPATPGLRRFPGWNVGLFATLSADPTLGRAEAMRRTMLSLLDDKSSTENAYPAIWGPFAVIAEGN